MPVLPIPEKPSFAAPTGGATSTGSATNATQKTRFLRHPKNSSLRSIPFIPTFILKHPKHLGSGSESHNRESRRV